MPIIEIIKKNKKIILIIGTIALVLLFMPIISILIEIIFKYGTYVGSFIRNIGTNICP